MKMAGFFVYMPYSKNKGSNADDVSGNFNGFIFTGD